MRRGMAATVTPTASTGRAHLSCGTNRSARKRAVVQVNDDMGTDVAASEGAAMSPL